MGEVIHVDFAALKRLKTCREGLTKQQYTALRGQILAGDPAGAMKGLQTILNRK